MKLRVNKKVLAAMPSPVRQLVTDWQERYRKVFIAFKTVGKFYIEEDARYVAFSSDMQKSLSIRAGGEWAGVTDLMPGSDCPLPPGCTVVATGFFCGEPWLTIYHNAASVEPMALNSFNTQRLELAVR